MTTESSRTAMRLRENDGTLTFDSVVLLPLTLGIAVGHILYDRFAPPGTPRWTFVLFVGAALSVTALPVMARIIQERGLMRNAIGYVSLA